MDHVLRAVAPHDDVEPAVTVHIPERDRAPRGPGAAKGWTPAQVAAAVVQVHAIDLVAESIEFRDVSAPVTPESRGQLLKDRSLDVVAGYEATIKCHRWPQLASDPFRSRT